MKRWKNTVILLVLLVTCTGCSSLVNTRSYSNPQVDSSFYKKVGLLPLRNNVEDRLAGEKIGEVFLTELLIAGEMDVMDQGQFNAVVSQTLKTNAPLGELNLSNAQLKEIAEFAGVQGVFMGSVNDYKTVSLGGEQYPMITMTMKFLDAPSGTIVWQNTTSATGGPNLPIVTIGETFTLGALSQKVCREIVRDFYKKVFLK